MMITCYNVVIIEDNCYMFPYLSAVRCMTLLHSAVESSSIVDVMSLCISFTLFTMNNMFIDGNSARLSLVRGYRESTLT